jgi:excisionase family DNA binding protein
MKLEVELSEESLEKLAVKVAARMKPSKKESPKREVIIPTKQDFQYTVHEVAAMTKSSDGTITRHIREKLLAATKVGKSWKISHENYLKYIENENN